MIKSDQIKILNNKIKANNAQYDINRLNDKNINQMHSIMQNLSFLLWVKLLNKD